MSSGILTPTLQVTHDTTVRKIRELPVPGEILFKVGDVVKASDTVAQAFLAGDLYILRVAEKMGIQPFEVINGIKVKEGDEVSVGAPISEHKGLFGLFRSTFPSPVSGKVEFITPQTGHVGVRTAPVPIKLDAYISGRVASVTAGKSITIESHAALVQGIFGVGGEKKGIIRLLKIDSGTKILPEHIPSSCSGEILIGGTRPSAEALNAASSRGAVGLVTGAIDDKALAAYLGYDLGIALTGDEDVSMTMILTEGFGEIPLSPRILELLKTLEGKEASINGATQVRAGALRPEIIVCHDSAGDSSRSEKVEGKGLEVGRKIRIIRVPFFGQNAEVVELPHEAQKIETGAYTRVLRAKLADGKIIMVPRANVELV